ncbi:rhomboid family intramembrane serine protease [Clostridium weizhouense]|uniref:Rhomboid family intramembrane serine protease n=1 Tax=Clostridium weizhouense TaxID=2859781 RepID=A0ABS7AIY0_9CLOT|nr:rhomboid family intramembrane serine protease [Clostridium weizhouense]MBW6408621.1 rhomboid family intramembrane serine protease [Clostridium weizhouense]
MIELSNILYKYLINNDYFYMKQYYSNFHKTERYIAIKDIEEYIYCVLVTDEKYEEVDVYEAFEYIKTLGKSFVFNLVVLSNDEYVNIKHEYVNKIIIDKKTYNTILCDDSCKPLEVVINQYVRKNEFEVNNYLKNKGITLIIMCINIILFVLTAFLSNSLFSMDVDVLISFGAKYNKLIYEGEIWRLLTCAFLHGGLIHISCNMYMLYILGPQVEKIYGIKHYINIYLVSCLASSLLSFLLSPYISIGASGGIFGLLGAMLVFAIKERHKIEKSSIINLIGIIVLNLIIGFSIANVDNKAHIGGFLGGIISSYLILSFKKRINRYV